MLSTLSVDLPLHVHAGGNLSAELDALVGARRLAIVTSAGWLRRGLPDFVRRAMPPTTHIALPAPSHPRIDDIAKLEDSLPAFDAILAIGGGSVIDAAKAVTALRARGGNAKFLDDALRGRARLPADLDMAPVIAVPTTSGTGSEVNSWATLWGSNREKASLSHPALKPQAVFLDPALCVGMSQFVTLSSGLDALSHAMEAIWNVNATPASDTYAIAAIREIRASLPGAMSHPHCLRSRGNMQIAAVKAGLAMSKTQTALSHSISYRLTAEFGLPHGFASAITLGEVAHFNAQAFPDRVSLIADAFDCELDELRNEIHFWMIALRVPAYIRQFIYSSSVEKFGADLIHPARAANNVRPADAEDAKQILHNALRIFAK